MAPVPAWVWVAGIVVASFGGRLFAAVPRLTPYYLPDEYISLARPGSFGHRAVSVRADRVRFR